MMMSVLRWPLVFLFALCCSWSVLGPGQLVSAGTTKRSAKVEALYSEVAHLNDKLDLLLEQVHGMNVHASGVGTARDKGNTARQQQQQQQQRQLLMGNGGNFDGDRPGVFLSEQAVLGIGSAELSVDAGTNALHLNTSFNVELGLHTPTVNTGHGDNEVYPADQNLRTTDNVVFNSVSVGTIDALAGAVGVNIGGVNFKNGLVDGVDITALSANNFAQDQDLRSTDNVQFQLLAADTVNTGNGANELYAMNQNVRSTDSVQFAGMTVAGSIDVDGLVDGVDVGLVGGMISQHLHVTSMPVFFSVNTGHGDNELFPMNQNVRTTDAVQFLSVNVDTVDTGHGANELYAMDQDVRTVDAVTFQSLTVNGDLTVGGLVDGVSVALLGNNVDQDLRTSSAPVFAALDTGYGPNELFSMDQDVRTIDSPTFAGISINGNLNVIGEVAGVDVGALEALVLGNSLAATNAAALTSQNAGKLNQAVKTTSDVTFSTIDTGQGPGELFAMDQDVRVGDDVTFASVVVTGDMVVNGLVDGVHVPTLKATVDAHELSVPALKSALDALVDQDVRMGASPSFASVTVAAVHERSLGAGVDAEGVVLKDGLVDGVNISALNDSVSMILDNTESPGMRWQRLASRRPLRSLPPVSGGGLPTDLYGSSGVDVSADGSTIVIGSAGVDSSAGRVHVMRWDGLQWGVLQVIDAFDRAPGDMFGMNPRISADATYILVGAHKEDAGGVLDYGSAYLYSWNVGSSQYIYTQKLMPSGAGLGDMFGLHMAMSADNQLLFGDGRGSIAGACYVWKWNGATFAPHQTLYAPSAAAGDAFGRSAVDGVGMTLAVAAPGRAVSGLEQAGMVVVYVWNGAAFAEQQTLYHTAPAVNHTFGASVAMSGDGRWLMVGSSMDSRFHEHAGSVHVFEWDAGSSLYGLQRVLHPSNAAPGLHFGRFLALSGDGGTLAVGTQTGSAYRLHWIEGNWVEMQIDAFYIDTGGVGGPPAVNDVHVATSFDGATLVNSLAGRLYVVREPKY